MNLSAKALSKFLSRIPQTNYTTPTTPVANAFIREEPTQRSQGQQRPRTENNAEHATGKGFATRSDVIAWDTTDNWPVNLTAENIGRYLLAAMGKVTTTQPDDEEDPDVYVHKFEPLPLNVTQLPAYSTGEHVLPTSGGISRLYPSMIAKAFKIAASGIAKITGALDWVGSGLRTSPSGVTESTHVTEIAGTQHPFYKTQGELIISETDGLTDLVNRKCDLLSLNFGVDNTLADDDYGCPRFLITDNPDSGAIRSQHLCTNQTFSMDFLIKYQASSPEHAAMIARSAKRLVIKFIGAAIAFGDNSGDLNYELKITVYNAKYSMVEDSFENGFATVKVTPEALWSLADNKIVDIDLTNTVESYLI